MPKDRDRALNPATAQLKADKAKALKKGKAAVAAQRQERLAHRNPARLESQIDELRGSTSLRDQKQLKELEQELARVQKAREALGTDRDRDRGSRRDGDGGWGGSVLGKRPRGGFQGRRDDGGRARFDRRDRNEESSGEETDESVRRIPMPRDTPPPPPRRERRRPPHEHKEEGEQEEKPKPQASQTVYESAPALRDLKKEAVTGLVPTAVLRRRAEAKEPAEGDGLRGAEGPAKQETAEHRATDPDAVQADDEVARLEEEERRWRMEMEDLQGEDEGGGEATRPHQVEMEDVEDEDA